MGNMGIIICLSQGGLRSASALFTSLAKEVMFLVALVVCLFVDITQKVMNGLKRNYRAGSWVVQ